MNRFFGTTLCAALVIMLGACGGPSGAPSVKQVPGQKARSNTVTRRAVSRAEFGEKWPLTVEAGEIECIDGHWVVFHHEGVGYALNGLARSRGYASIDPIWKDDPATESKVNINPLTQAALKLCE